MSRIYPPDIPGVHILINNTHLYRSAEKQIEKPRKNLALDRNRTILTLVAQQFHRYSMISFLGYTPVGQSDVGFLVCRIVRLESIDLINSGGFKKPRGTAAKPHTDDAHPNSDTQTTLLT